MSRSVCDVLYDKGKQRPENAGSDTVEQLHAHQPVGVIRQRVEEPASGQDSEPHQKDRLSPPRVGPGPDHIRHRHHHDLRRDDARRHQRRSFVSIVQRQQLADQRQHRRVGEVERDNRRPEDHQFAVVRKHGEPRRLRMRLAGRMVHTTR